MTIYSLLGLGYTPTNRFTFFEKRPLSINGSDTPEKIKRLRDGKLKPGKLTIIVK